MINRQVWVDSEYRRMAIDTAALDNAILYHALNTARANGPSRETAIECALLMLCEENKRLFDHVVDAESRATPRNMILAPATTNKWDEKRK